MEGTYRHAALGAIPNGCVGKHNGNKRRIVFNFSGFCISTNPPRVPELLLGVESPRLSPDCAFCCWQAVSGKLLFMLDSTPWTMTSGIMYTATSQRLSSSRMTTTLLRARVQSEMELKLTLRITTEGFWAGSSRLSFPYWKHSKVTHSLRSEPWMILSQMCFQTR